MKKLLFPLLAVLVLAGCQSKPITGETISTTGEPYQSITPTELGTMLGSKDLVLVNVHIPFAGNIPGTDASIPYNENVDFKDADAKLVVSEKLSASSGASMVHEDRQAKGLLKQASG